MGRMVNCVKMGREMEGLDEPPFDGPLGQRIYDNVSLDGWKMWLEFSKMIVNEYRVDLTSASGQKMLHDQAEKYFFGEGAELPPDFVAPQAK